MRRRKKGISYLYSSFAIITVLVVWQIYAIHINNPHLMPEPLDVLSELIRLLGEWKTYQIILSTLRRLFISLSISMILGTFFGILSAILYRFEAFFKPIVISLRTLPIISIIVVVLIFFGNTMTLYVISFLLLFPIVYQGTLDGVKNIDPLLIDVLSLESSGIGIEEVRMVYFPLAKPFLRTSLIESLGLGIKVLIVAEYIAQTKVSIGREIYMARISLEFSTVFAWTIILLIIVISVEYLVERNLKTRRQLQKI